MVNNDTEELLKECEQGVKMGIEAIAEVVPHTEDESLKNILTEYSARHRRLDRELSELMRSFGLERSEANPVARGMSYLKTNFKLMMSDGDKTVADLMTDGCSMGIKSLNKYLNQYESAQECAKAVARKIIRAEEEFSAELEKYL